MNIAIFGGSFDPVHIGHTQIIETALEELDIDKLVVVPAYLNPFKDSFLAKPEVRFSWLKELFTGDKKVEVDSFEIEQNRATPSIKTVKYLKKKLNPQKIYLIIGADNLPLLHKWSSFEKLNKLVEFVVASREGFKVPTKYKKLSVDMDISSTILRADMDSKYLPNMISNNIKQGIKCKI